MDLLQIKDHALIPTGRGRIALAFGRSTFLLKKKLASVFLKHRDVLIEDTARKETLPSNLLTFLTDHNLLKRNRTQTSSSDQVFTSEEAEEIIASAIEMWRPLLGLHKIFVKMQKNRSLQATYLLEQTVFVSSAFNYLRLGAKVSKDRHIKKELSEVAQGERFHFLRLLDNLDLSYKDFERHDPVPGTRSLIAFLHDLASRCPRGLMIVSALFKSLDDDLESIQSFYKGVAKDLNLDLDHFVEHHVADIKLGHSGIWKKALRDKTSFSHADVSALVESLHTAKHMIELWFDSIITESKRRKYSPIRGMRSLIRPRPDASSIHVS